MKEILLHRNPEQEKSPLKKVQMPENHDVIIFIFNDEIGETFLLLLWDVSKSNRYVIIILLQ